MDVVFRISFSRFHPDWADKCTSSFDSTEWIGCQKKHTTMKLVFFWNIHFDASQNCLGFGSYTSNRNTVIWCWQGLQNPVWETTFLKNQQQSPTTIFFWILDGASTGPLIAGRCGLFLGWIARFRWSGAHKSHNDARSKSRIMDAIWGDRLGFQNHWFPPQQRLIAVYIIIIMIIITTIMIIIIMIKK